MGFVESYLAHWHPSRGWAKDFVRPAYLQCGVAPRARESIPAWKQLAIMLGDTRATPLCLVVVLFARSICGPSDDKHGLGAHLDLCLLDLDLGHGKDGPVALSELGEPEAIERDGAKLGAWLLRELAPFDGDLERAARFSLRLAALRTGVIVGPEEPTLGQLLDDTAWTVA